MLVYLVIGLILELIFKSIPCVQDIFFVHEEEYVSPFRILSDVMCIIALFVFIWPIFITIAIIYRQVEKHYD
jgi:hypothetical protein